ncbi:hypothetical protein [Clostridium massiliamazoniense]|uniref:hypothetical protein n=1 Tax=Clostridium massiliamazoniense TaxID=1347366 RepID=UPI0006D7EB14|nr:hypothetical protein [Clostridium massiliamazoniense]
MAHGKLYRSFIILQEDEKGHSIANDKPLSGYAKVEVRNDRCKVAFYAQNLKKDYGKCSMMLICNKKDTEVLLDLGTMNITPQGKAEISIEFDANNIGNSGVSYDKVVGASLCKKDTGNLKSLMCGFLNGEKPTSNWKSYKKLICVKPEDKVSEVKQMKEVPTMPKEKKEAPVTKKVAPVTEKVMPITENVEKAKVSTDKKTECGCVKSRSKYDEYENYIDNSDIEEGKIVVEDVSEEEKRESDTKLEKKGKESESSIEKEEREEAESENEESKKSESEKRASLEKEEREEVKEKEQKEDREKIRKETREETREESEEKEETKEEGEKENDEYANYKSYERRRYSNSEEGQIGKYTYQEDDDDFTLRGTLGEFFEAVVDSLEQTRCTNEIRKCKWYKVPVKSFDSMCNIVDYNKYTALYYPMTNYYPYISKHGHFVVGLKCDKYGNVKYLVYGIKGSKEKGQQPYDGKTGFVTWAPSPELGKDMGYWLMFYDFKNNIVVVPSK